MHNNEPNINNLFTFCNYSNNEDNVYYYIKKEIIGNCILTLAIKDNKILSSSCEYLTILKHAYYPSNHMYTEIINGYNYILNKIINNNISYINDDVISFITSFSTGTAHGYAGLFYNLIHYNNNYNELNYKNKKIVVYQNSQKGIKDIIEYLATKSIISNNIIYLEPSIIYKFNNMVIIENEHHGICDEFALIVSNFIDKYFIKNNFLIKLERISIIKSNESTNLCDNGICAKDDIIKFNINNNLTFIEPTDYNEVDFINILYNAKIIVMSWGTTFFKNYYYISDNCTHIYVLIIGTIFIDQYNFTKTNNYLITNFKNTIIEYIIVSDNINNILLIDSDYNIIINKTKINNFNKIKFLYHKNKI